jgi:xanthosine utilization system XapX-like protein
MRYTKMALLTFGAGLMLGLIVVVTEFDPLDRAASGLMALGLFGIPVGMIVDWRLATRAARRPAKKRAGNAGRRALPASSRRPPRPRKPAPPKR